MRWVAAVCDDLRSLRSHVGDEPVQGIEGVRILIRSAQDLEDPLGVSPIKDCQAKNSGIFEAGARLGAHDYYLVLMKLRSYCARDERNLCKFRAFTVQTQFGHKSLGPLMNHL